MSIDYLVICKKCLCSIILPVPTNNIQQNFLQKSIKFVYNQDYGSRVSSDKSPSTMWQDPECHVTGSRVTCDRIPSNMWKDPGYQAIESRIPRDMIPDTISQDLPSTSWQKIEYYLTGSQVPCQRISGTIWQCTCDRIPGTMWQDTYHTLIIKDGDSTFPKKKVFMWDFFNAM